VTKTTNQYVNNRLDTHIDNYVGTNVKYIYNDNGELRQVNETKDNTLVSRVSTTKNTYGMIGAKIVLLGENTVVRNNYIYKNDPFNRCLVGESILLDDTQKANVTYNYDKFGRLTSKSVPFAVNYDYTTLNNGNRLTNQINKVTYHDNSFEQYEYDANGNITKVTLSNGDTIEYTYDSFNRLVEEVNCAFNQRTIITYDKGGNITQKRVVSCQNATDETIDYSYDNQWKDQLTSYNGQAITYDEIGNPLTYKGNTLYWTRGRLLDAYGNKACYEYNSAGIRVEKCVNGVPTKYVVSGSTILSETTGGVTTVYYHSTDGVIGFNRAGIDYFYRKNIQGDIIAIVNTSGDIVAKYIYDAWGNHKVFNELNAVVYDSTNPGAYPAYTNHIGCLNPFRYRSYYFDSETGLYYLNSRYYDPQVGRFINADRIDYLAPENIQGLNLYSYCMNNPIMYADPSGHFPFFLLVALLSVGVTAAVDYIPDQEVNLHWGWYAGAAVLGAAVGLGISYYATGSAFSSVGKVFSGLFGKTTLYRSVGPDELADIQKTSKFNLGKGMESKQFGLSLDETRLFGKHSLINQPNIVGAKIPNRILYRLDFTPVDIGIFKSGVVTVQSSMLNTFNNSLLGIMFL